MKEIICIFSFKVKQENETAYQNMLDTVLEKVQNEPGTLMYEIFKDKDGVYCQHERYANEAALWEHVQNTAPELQQWFEFTEIQQLIILGDISDKMIETYNVKEYYTPFKRV